MKLSQAIVISICCLGLMGCADTLTRSGSLSPSAPAPGAGPLDRITAPLAPLPGGSSTISVSPERAMYNLGPSPAKPKALPKDNLPRKDIKVASAQPAKKTVKAAVKSPPKAIDPVDSSIIASPVRKASAPAPEAASAPAVDADAELPVGEAPYKPGEAPQSAVPVRPGGPTSNIMPISNSADTQTVDSRFSS